MVTITAATKSLTKVSPRYLGAQSNIGKYLAIFISKRVDRDFHVAHAIVLRRWHVTRAHIDLYRWQNEFRHGERCISFIAHLDERIARGAILDMDIGTFLLSNRRFPDIFVTPRGFIVVAKEHTCVVREIEQHLD